MLNVVVIENVRGVGDGVWLMSAWLKNDLFIPGNGELGFGAISKWGRGKIVQ